MNILFFLEPTIEFGNPLFRYATLRNSIIPQIRSLSVDGCNVYTVISTAVANESIEQNHFKDILNAIVIDSFEWSAGENYNQRSLRHQKNDYREGEIERLNNILKSALPTDFTPDAVISWESPINFIEHIFPQAKIIYQMPGFFSRPPFSNLISFSNELLSIKKPTDTLPSPTELVNFQELKYLDLSFLTSVDPTLRLINKTKLSFSKVILFPLQIDNYFMIDSVIGKDKSQLDVLQDILASLPGNIALVVTNYVSKDNRSSVLTKNGVKYLRSKHKNFIYHEEFDNIPWSSQFIVPNVDGVITISSSVGFQAAYWEKPLLAIGESHITPFSTAMDMTTLIDQVNSGHLCNQDGQIISHIEKSQVPMSFISGKNYSSWLSHYISGASPSWSGESLSCYLRTERREEALLSALNFFDRNRNNSTDKHSSELSQQIIKHDVISFDVFDTLLFRPFRSPSDLFDFLQEDMKSISSISTLNFKNERRKAEKEAFEASIERGEYETTLDEIYSKLQFNLNISEQTALDMMQKEIAAEKEILYKRNTGYTAFLEAKNLNKDIIIISDMYMSEDTISEILHKNGYYGYKKLYVSSKYKEKKHSGRLFDIVISDLNIPAEKILHIGDNLDADIIKAKSRGIKPFHLPKSNDLFSSNSDFIIPWKRDEQRHSLDWKMILAIIGNKIHDNPYIPHRKGTLFGGSAEKLGYYGFGPLLLGYTKWLIENAIRDNVEHLYFLSRDGKIMKQAYDLVSPLYPNAPISHYLLCSRRAVNIAKVKKIDDIIDLLNVDFANNVKLSHLVKHRFGVEISNLPENVLKSHNYSADSKLTTKDIPHLEKLFLDLENYFLDAAKLERDNYLSYLNSMEIFNKGKRAIVDIGYAGTMQESLYQLSDESCQLGGYYLITFRTAVKRVFNKSLPIKGYLAEFIDRHDTYHPFCKYVPLYETLFSSVDTTFIRMAKDWNNKLRPVFMPNSQIEEKRERVVQEIHKGATEFISEVISILNKNLIKIDFEPNKTLRVLDNFFKEPHPRDANIFSGIVFEDAYGGTHYKTILADKDNLHSQSVWKAGHSALKLEDTPSIIDNREPPLASVTISSIVHQKSSVIHWFLRNTLSEKKKNKFLKKPQLFFGDSKNPLIKMMGRIYLRD